MLFKPVPIIGPVQIETNLAVPARHHNYLVGGNMVNGFAVGTVGAEDDFWLVALEPPAEGEGACRPVIFANLLDAFGRRLVTLERNVPTFNPRSCAVRDADGELAVTQPDGREALRVRTSWVKALGYHVSHFHGRWKDRTGVVRAEARGDAQTPSLHVYGKMAYGIRPNGTFAHNEGLSADEVRRVMEWAGLA